MSTLTIRKVPREVVASLEEKAKRKDISREHLLRDILRSYVESEGIRETENRYDSLVKQYRELTAFCVQRIEEATAAMDRSYDFMMKREEEWEE